MSEDLNMPEETAISSFWQESEGLRREYIEIAQRLNYIEASIAQMQDDIAALDDRQSSQLVAMDAARTDISDDRHIAQLDIARKYLNFVEQDLFSLAREEVSFSRSRAPRREWIPRSIGSMCTELFRVGAEPTLHARSERRHDVLAAAVEIRGLADQSGLNYCWDFYLMPGRLLDDKWQQPWGRCDPKDPIKFLVAPAYVVDHLIYQRQQVFTAPRIRTDLFSTHSWARHSGLTQGKPDDPRKETAAVPNHKLFN